jgi:uncharacterized membrane protein
VTTPAPTQPAEHLEADRAGRWAAAGLAALFLTSGTIHLVRPQVFESIIPPWLPRWMPDARALVYLSGVAELGCAAGLLHPRTRRVAGLVSAVLLVAVFPANVQMALDAHRHAARTSAAYRAVTYVRLPLQVPLVLVALRAAGRRRHGAGRNAGERVTGRPIP